MNTTYTESLNRLIDEFSRLPGIGPKSAERIAMHILKTRPEEAMKLAEAIKDVKTKIKHCRICHNISEQEICQICADARRDKSIICVVEQPRDVINLEKTGLCKWVYHVLGGHIAPLENIEPADLTIDKLIERVRKGGVNEIVMATNPNLAGDGTALYISSLLTNTTVKITRLARGIATGSTIEYASGKMLTDAIIGRREMK